MENKTKYSPLLLFIYSFASTTHLVPVSLILPILLAYYLSNSKLSSKLIIISIISFVIPLIPLIIFDFRHDFINLKSLFNFIVLPKTNSENISFLFLRSFWRSISYLNINISIGLIIFRISIILICIYEIFKFNQTKQKIFFFVWFITPLLLLSFYKGNIPEYYYGASNIIIPILLAIFIDRFNSKILVTLIILILGFNQYEQLIKPISGITLKNKTSLVKYVINQKTDPIFNISYDLPIGWNTGYEYLFNYYKKTPQNIPQGHLYTVYLLSNTAPSGDLVYQDNILGLVRK
jgi:hypothetical protein